MLMMMSSLMKQSRWMKQTPPASTHRMPASTHEPHELHASRSSPSSSSRCARIVFASRTKVLFQRRCDSASFGLRFYK